MRYDIRTVYKDPILCLLNFGIRLIIPIKLQLYPTNGKWRNRETIDRWVAIQEVVWFLDEANVTKPKPQPILWKTSLTQIIATIKVKIQPNILMSLNSIEMRYDFFVQKEMFRCAAMQPLHKRETCILFPGDKFLNVMVYRLLQKPLYL